MRVYVGRVRQPFERRARRELQGVTRPRQLYELAGVRQATARVGRLGLIFRECAARTRRMYRSVSSPGCECSDARIGAGLMLWDGKRISRVYEKSEVLFEL